MPHRTIGQMPASSCLKGCPSGLARTEHRASNRRGTLDPRLFLLPVVVGCSRAESRCRVATSSAEIHGERRLTPQTAASTTTASLVCLATASRSS